MCGVVLVKNLEYFNILTTWFIYFFLENLFIYQELCLTKCPNNTNEEEEIINNPVTGEKGLKRICKPCEDSKCKKSTNISKLLSTIKDN